MDRLKFILLFCVFFFVGCAAYSVSCPTFPAPSQSVLDKIKSLNDREVDCWMENMLKLNRKLKVCKERK